MKKTIKQASVVKDEKRSFEIYLGSEEFLFTFNFDFSPKEVSFTLELNPKFKRTNSQTKPVASTETKYTFDKDDKCAFVHETKEGYFVKGRLEIISFENPIGQFADRLKNFLFDIEYGRENSASSKLQGLFELIEPAADHPA